jgi:nitroreductase
MDLSEALRETAAIREFTDEPVPDEMLYRILETARFAPSGGNRQGWRVIAVRDAALKRGMRELYLPGWLEYIAMTAAGLVAWSPAADPDAEAAALTSASRDELVALFARQFERVPAMLVVLADPRELAAPDRDHDRYTFAGGASVYPFVWSILLAARGEGLGGVMTTMHIRREAPVKELLNVPDQLALAAVVFLGHPRRQPSRLRRSPVPGFATFDTYDGAPVSLDACGPGIAD